MVSLLRWVVACSLWSPVPHRNGEWLLHISAVEGAIKLFLAFDRTNFSRWVPLYLQDCLKLEQEFPLIYGEFMEKGSFVVRHTHQKCSAVPIDQALEKEYNKAGKGKG